MKKTVLMLMVGILLFAVNLYAGDGDLIVTGEVGIGIATNTPSAALDVVGIGKFVNGSFSTTIGNMGNELRLTNSAGISRLRIITGDQSSSSAIRLQNASGNVGDLKLASDGVMSMAIDDVDRISFTADGNVGIGTSNPQSKLSVAGLPITPPGGAQSVGVLCVTVNGDIWIDNDGDTLICQ